MSTLHNKAARGRRGIALTVGSLAVLALAGTTATQAFASQGAHAFAHQGTHRHAAFAALTSHHLSDQAEGGRNDKETPFAKAGSELAKAVTDVVPGTTTDVSGARVTSSNNPKSVEARLTLAPADGSAGGPVTAAFVPEASYGGSHGKAETRAWLKTCRGTAPDCQTSTLPDGSLVRVSSTHQEVSGGTWEMNVVERDIHGVVEVVVAYGPRDADGTVTAPHASLTTDQLVDVASRLAPLR